MAIKYVEPVYKVTEKPRTLWEGGVPSWCCGLEHTPNKEKD